MPGSCRCLCLMGSENRPEWVSHIDDYVQRWGKSLIRFYYLQWANICLMRHTPLPPEESIVNNWLPFYKNWNLYDVWERWNQRLNSLLESCLSARNAHHLIPLPPLSSSLIMPKACSRKLTLARAVLFLGMTIGEPFRISHVVLPRSLSAFIKLEHFCKVLDV